MARIAIKEGAKPEHFKINDDNSLSLLEIKEKLPRTIGLRYRYKPNGLLRAVRIYAGNFYLPFGVSWSDYVFHCVYDVNSEIKVEHKKKYTSLAKYYGLDAYDMIVMNIPDSIGSDGLLDFFSKFGKLDLCELKYDHKTGRSRSYGFIRYANFDDQYKCINSDLVLNGSEMFLRLPTSKVDDSICLRRILVGNVTPSVTMIDLLEYFNVFGKISEIFMPIAIVPYAFITFENNEAVHNVFKFGQSHRVFGGFVIAERMHSKKELDDAQNSKDPVSHRNKKGGREVNTAQDASVNGEVAHPHCASEFTPSHDPNLIISLNGASPRLNPQIFPINNLRYPPPNIPQIQPTNFWNYPPPITPQSVTQSCDCGRSTRPMHHWECMAPPPVVMGHPSFNLTCPPPVIHQTCAVNNQASATPTWNMPEFYNNTNQYGGDDHSMSERDHNDPISFNNNQHCNPCGIQLGNDTTTNNPTTIKTNEEMLSLQLVSDVTMRLLKTCNSEAEKKILAKLLLGIISESSSTESQIPDENAHNRNSVTQASVNDQGSASSVSAQSKPQNLSPNLNSNDQ